MRAPPTNAIVSDEIFAAAPAGKGTDDAAPLRDRGSRLETRSDSAQVADTLVAMAHARGWDEIRVTGSAAFCREVWLEAEAHGMHVRGYVPNRADQAELARRRHEPKERPVPDDLRAAIEAIDRQATADGLTPEQRAIVMARVRCRAHQPSTQETASPMIRNHHEPEREITR